MHFARTFSGLLKVKIKVFRTVICSKECRSLFDHLSLQEKYSVIISYVFQKKFQDFPGYFPFSLFSRTFPGLEI